jgi:hypothetical protein
MIREAVKGATQKPTAPLKRVNRGSRAALRQPRRCAPEQPPPVNGGLPGPLSSGGRDGFEVLDHAGRFLLPGLGPCRCRQPLGGVVVKVAVVSGESAKGRL